MRFVYVLQAGEYEQRRLYGVYATLKAAMAAWQPERPEPAYYSYSWKACEDGESWEFDSDATRAADIYKVRVQGSE